MVYACELMRTVLRSGRVAGSPSASRALSGSASSRGPTQRQRTARPSTPTEWNVVRRQLRGDAPQDRPPLPPLSDAVLSRPALVPLSDPAVFTHPSYAAHEPKRTEVLDADGKLRLGKSTNTFERHELLGRSLLDFTVKELLLERFPSMRPVAVKAVADRLLSPDILTVLALSYNLKASLRVDPVAAETIAADQEVPSALFRSYVAGLHLERGPAVARDWIHECFASVINHDYSIWRSSANAAELQEAVGTPLYRLDEFCKRRDIKPQWNILWKGSPDDRVFKAEVELPHGRAVGSGRSIQQAKQNAAALALKLKDAHSAVAAEPEPAVQYTKQLHLYARKHGLARPTFDTVLVIHPLYECRLQFEGREYVARGEGLVGARVQAAKAALEAMGVV